LGCAFRITSFILFILIQENLITVNGSFLYLTSSLPSFLFLTFYSAALVISVGLFQISTTTKPANMKKLSLIVKLANAFLYLILAVLFALDFSVFPDEVISVNAPTSVFQKTIQFIIVGMYLLASVLFFIYVSRLYMNHYHTNFKDANINEDQIQLKKKSSILVFVSCVCFLIRSVLTCLTIFYPGAQLWWKDLAYYLLLEIIPLSLLLYIYNIIANSTPGLGIDTFHPYSQIDEHSRLTANSGYIATRYG